MNFLLYPLSQGCYIWKCRKIMKFIFVSHQILNWNKTPNFHFAIFLDFHIIFKQNPTETLSKPRKLLFLCSNVKEIDSKLELFSGWLSIYIFVFRERKNWRSRQYNVIKTRKKNKAKMGYFLLENIRIME